MSDEIITNAQMRAIDARSAALGTPTRLLMENAGRAVADAICARFAPCTVTALCGPGNNGGDGWVAARFLMERGWPVRVESLVDRAALEGDAADAAAAFMGEIAPARGAAGEAALYIDALFGAGLARPLEGEAAHLAMQLGQSPERVIAVDTPSGLPGDGEAPAGAVMRAGLTVTFVRKKPAHVLAAGRARCGEIVVADIGTPEQALAEQNVRLWENGPAQWRLPWPDAHAHKHARGHVMTVSGGFAQTGAARLAARAALRAGAGLVTVLSPPDALA
ncbi:MAG: NAD(P)H-hydrate epimerase, partial [Hyphomonadaceae bacterium]